MTKTNTYIFSSIFLMVALAVTQILQYTSHIIPFRAFIDPIGYLPMFGPMITSILFILTSKKDSFTDISFKWFDYKPIVIVILIYCVAFIFEKIIQILFGLSILNANINKIWLFKIDFNLVPGFTIYAILYMLYAGFGEEICWRGYFFHKLKGLSWLENILLLNITWALWHLPGYILYGNLIQFLLFAFLCIEIGILLTYVRISTNSVIPAMILHAFINTLYIIDSKLMIAENKYFSGFPNIIAIVVILPVSIYYFRKAKTIYDMK